MMFGAGIGVTVLTVAGYIVVVTWAQQLREGLITHWKAGLNSLVLGFHNKVLASPHLAPVLRAYDLVRNRGPMVVIWRAMRHTLFGPRNNQTPAAQLALGGIDPITGGYVSVPHPGLVANGAPVGGSDAPVGGNGAPADGSDAPVGGSDAPVGEGFVDVAAAANRGGGRALAENVSTDRSSLGVGLMTSDGTQGTLPTPVRVGALPPFAMPRSPRLKSVRSHESQSESTELQALLSEIETRGLGANRGSRGAAGPLSPAGESALSYVTQYLT